MIWGPDFPYQGTTVIKKNKFCHLQQWMNGTEIYYAKWNKSYRKKTNAIWYQLYMESKEQSKLIIQQKRDVLTKIKNKLLLSNGGGKELGARKE